MKIVAFLILIAPVVYAQVPASGASKSDAEKIADALRAGPAFVTKDATVLDRPSSPGGEFRVLRTGTSAWIMQTLNHDGSNGEPYVNHLAGHSELYLVIPIREWDDSQAVSTVGTKR